jgi:plasmid stabilization system protein ParE
MNYEFHPDAELGLIEEAAYYESEVPGLGSRFAGEVDHVIELLLGNPKIGALVDEELRHFVLRRFPHSIIYVVFKEKLFIIAVAHGSRNPGYWRSRISR